MYYLIYDHYLAHNKYRKDIAQLETRLTDLGVQYKTNRLTLLKSLGELVKLGVKHEAHTIVAVGGDELVGKIVNHIAPLENVTLGVVPIGDQSYIADFLGVPAGRAACEILSARKIEVIDLGKISQSTHRLGGQPQEASKEQTEETGNNKEGGVQYFMISAEAEESDKVAMEFDSHYQISPDSARQMMGVYNFNYHVKGRNQKTNPQDGWLHAMVVPTKENRFSFLNKQTRFLWGSETVIPTKTVRFTSTNSSTATIITDRTRVFKTPLTMSVDPKQLKVIVGTDRMF